jgi:glycosyltransferase involved in cell wall biosynthesis
MLNPSKARTHSTTDDLVARYHVAVLVPCLNEEATVADVVTSFRRSLPLADIYVYDNGSTDRTVEVARVTGAIIRREARQGKGYVVRRMFADIDADIYVLVDGDGTYDAASAPGMVARLVEDRVDMVVGCRVENEKGAFRRGHRSGNKLLTRSVSSVFGKSITDMLSGYRVLSHRFVKSFPVLSGGFEVETELTIHTLELGLPVTEVATPYYARASGSKSKLSTWRDGWRILWTITRLYKSERPLLFFALIGMLLACLSIGLAVPLFVTYLEIGLVPRLPTAVLATGLMLLAFLSLTCGLVLGTVTRGRREMKLLAYMAQPALPDRSD